MLYPRFDDTEAGNPAAAQDVSAGVIDVNSGSAYAPDEMTQALYLLAAILVGGGSALQIGLVGSLGRMRGSTEATWISVLGSVTGLALVFVFKMLRDHSDNFDPPFNNTATFAAIALIAGAALALTLRGLDPYFALTGLFGITYLVGASYLAPRIGIALFASAVTAGTLIGSVGLDHIGAFGAEVQRVSAVRVLGLASLLLGVMLVRSGR